VDRWRRRTFFLSWLDPPAQPAHGLVIHWPRVLLSVTILAMTQWHPLFAQLLRPLVEGYYEVQTDVPVGDVPRQADLVLVRRIRARASPFRGLWKGLTTWNVLEFKGPTVSPRHGDLDRLVELGLGIHRRLNEERIKQKQPPVEAEEVSFWYLANRLGSRYLGSARAELGELEPLGEGIWRCRVLRRLIYLVSGSDLPVERDSLPLHVLGRESLETELAVARVVAAEPALLRTFGEWVTGFHPAAKEEMWAMARTKSREFKFYLEPFIELMGIEEVIRQLGPERLIDQLGPKRLIEQLGPKRLIEHLGPERVLELMGPDKLVEKKGVDWFLAKLTPAQRRELKRRLQ
jgi:hypothetical protein